MTEQTSAALGATRDAARVSRPDFSDHALLRASLVECIRAAKGGAAATEIAGRLWPSDHATQAVIKAAVAPGTTGTHTGLQQAAVSSFLKGLPASAAAAIMRESVVIPDLGYSDLKAPYDNSTVTESPWVGEAEPIPVYSGVIGSVNAGAVRKMAFIHAFTRELFAKPGAEALFRSKIEARAATIFDTALFADTAGDATAVAGLLNGLTECFPARGQNYGEALAALVGALGGFKGSGRALIATDPVTAAALAIKYPMLKWPVFASSSLPTGRIVAVDPAGVVFGTSGTFDLLATQSAILHMSDEPAEIVTDAAAVADPVRELWQTDGIAFRLMVWITWAAKPGAVQFCDVGTPVF